MSQSFINYSAILLPNIDKSAFEILTKNHGVIEMINKPDLFGVDYPVEYAGIIKNLPIMIEHDSSYNRSQQALEILFQGLSQNVDFENLKIDKVLALFNPFSMLDTSLALKLNEFESYLKTGQLRLFKSILEKNNIFLNDSQIQFLDNSCVAGNAVLGTAYQGIKLDVWETCLVVAIDLFDAPAACMLKNLGALSAGTQDPDKASRPFDKKRNGFVKTDGAALAIISNRRIRKNDPEILSFSQTSDAYRLTDGRNDAESIKQAIRLSIEKAQLDIHDISFIKAHGTGTKLNDEHEAKAIKELFYEKGYRIPVTSLKGHIGHTTDASGLVETLLACDLFKSGLIPFTLNCDDPEFDLDIVRFLRRDDTKNVFLSNTSGFGGLNSCLALKIHKK